MRVLLVNDDGIDSAGLRDVALWARKKFGSITVVAPKEQQSGKSHSIEIHEFIAFEKREYLPGVTGYAVDSTPADCVRFAYIGLCEEYDLVISGINKGYNIGEDISYSGTVGAVFEAVLRGAKKCLALSTDHINTEYAPKYLDTVWDYIESHSMFSHTRLINVNIPDCTPKGILITRQGEHYYEDSFVYNDEGHYRQQAKFHEHKSDDLTLDSAAVKNGYISITPLTADRTDLRAYEKLLEVTK